MRKTKTILFLFAILIGSLHSECDVGLHIPFLAAYTTQTKMNDGDRVMHSLLFLSTADTAFYTVASIMTDLIDCKFDFGWDYAMTSLTMLHFYAPSSNPSYLPDKGYYFIWRDEGWGMGKMGTDIKRSILLQCSFSNLGITFNYNYEQDSLALVTNYGDTTALYNEYENLYMKYINFIYNVRNDQDLYQLCDSAIKSGKGNPLNFTSGAGFIDSVDFKDATEFGIEKKRPIFYVIVNDATYWTLAYGYADEVNPSVTVLTNKTSISEQNITPLINISPNPTSNYLNVELAETHNRITAEVLDLSGKVLFETNFENVQNFRINFPFVLSNGTYMLHINADGRRSYTNFIIAK